MSTLRVNRIEPRTGDSVEILGFGGGVSNIHKSFRNSDFSLTSGVWTRVMHNVNSIPNPSFSSATGIFTVGSGDGGLYYVNFNCNFSSTISDNGLRSDISAIYVNDNSVASASSNMGQVGPTMITTPVSTIIKLNDGDQVSMYAWTEGHSSGAGGVILGTPGKAISSWTMFRIGDLS